MAMRFYFIIFLLEFYALRNFSKLAAVVVSSFLNFIFIAFAHYYRVEKEFMWGMGWDYKPNWQ